jgi:transcription elongation factor GreB
MCPTSPPLRSSRLNPESSSPVSDTSAEKTNLVTPGGYRKLLDELAFLVKKERPRIVEEIQAAVKQGDRSENAEYQYGKKRLREIDRRVRFLGKRIELARVIVPSQQVNDCVRFGATVMVEYEDGRNKTFILVGEDEIDTAARKISWKSPIGRGLLKAKIGDWLAIEVPGGVQEFQVTDVRYVDDI